MATRDVYEKKGLPARIVTNETERTAAVFDGFQLVKDEKPAKIADESKTADDKSTTKGDTKAGPGTDLSQTTAVGSTPKPGPQTR